MTCKFSVLHFLWYFFWFAFSWPFLFALWHVQNSALPINMAGQWETFIFLFTKVWKPAFPHHTTLGYESKLFLKKHLMKIISLQKLKGNTQVGPRDQPRRDSGGWANPFWCHCESDQCFFFNPNFDLKSMISTNTKKNSWKRTTHIRQISKKKKFQIARFWG